MITDEDIRHSGATDLLTVLRRVPGIEVMQVTAVDFDVSVRGDNQLLANKLLVLVDGRSIYDDAEGEVSWKNIPITLPEIKRIEILKGPASAVYGFNAFDGVVNIITKSPEEMKGTTLQFGGGEFGTITASAIQAGTYDRFGYRLSLGTDQNSQWQNRGALAYRSHKFNLQTQYKLSDISRIVVSGGLVDVNRFAGQVFEASRTDSKLGQGYANIAYERGDFIARAWWSEFFDDIQTAPVPSLASILKFTDRSGSTLAKNRINTYNVDLQHGVHLFETHRLTYGINYRHTTFSGNFLDQFTEEDRLGLYFQDEWQVSRSLSILAGLRYDLHTEINATFSPRVAAIYRMAPEHTLRASVSVAYRPPTLFESHRDSITIVTLPGFPAIAIPSHGSHDLDPEQIVSYDLGYQGWILKHRLRIRADAFFDHITKLVQFLNTGEAINGGLADIYGGEAGVDFLATSWLSGFANFSYEEIGQTFTGTAQRGAPRFKWNAGLRGEWDNGFSGEAAIYHVGAATYPISSAFFQFAPLGGFTPPDTRVGSYNLLNLRGAYRFWQQQAAAGYTREAEVAVSVFNALNDMHKEHPLGDTIGSRVMGWLTLKF